MGMRRGVGQRGGAGQRHAAHDQALQAAVAGGVLGEIGVVVAFVPVTGMNAGLVMRRQAELEPGEIERRRDGQQQDEAKAEPCRSAVPRCCRFRFMRSSLRTA